MKENLFIRGLTENMPELVMNAPKSDLHNHAALGSRLEHLEHRIGCHIPKAPLKMKDLGEMDRYLQTHLTDHLMTPEGFEYAIGAAFSQAANDGIKVLQMSFDLRFFMKGIGHINDTTRLITLLQQEFAPGIRFIPQLGIDRAMNTETVTRIAEECIGSGWFRSVDLYGNELARDPKEFSYLYNIAGKAGLKLTAHAGEFGNAGLVRHTAEVLGLYEIQHGIALAASAELMKWAREHNIQLNICPSSNVRLSRVASLKSHPIRELFDNGIRVTVNTDDLMIFGQSVTDEFLNLYKAGVFNAQELDIIRLNGLAQK